MQKIQIGFLGFGNIGNGVYKILQKHRNEIADKEDYQINIKKILVRDINKKSVKQTEVFLQITLTIY